MRGDLPTHFSFGGFGSIDADVSAGGKLTASVSMRHTLRDAALHLDQSPFLNGSPVSAVTIDPSVTANAQLDALYLHLKLTADIDLGPFGDHTLTIFNNDLFNTGSIGATLDPKPWPEPNRFRLGTGSPSGDPLKAPQVWSHFPDASGTPALFSSFPAGNDVDSCLANPAQNQAPPAAC